MHKTISCLFVKVNDKEIRLTCDIDCSTIELKEAIYQFTKYIGQVEDAHASKLKEEQDSKVELDEQSKSEPIEV